MFLGFGTYRKDIFGTRSVKGAFGRGKTFAFTDKCENEAKGFLEKIY